MKMKRKNNIILSIIIIILSLWFFYPFYYILILSFNESFDTMRGGIYFFPRVFTLSNYKVVFRNQYIISGFMISISRVLIMGAITPVLCSLYGYALTFKDLIARRFFNILIIIPMYVSGGVIPFYMILRSLGLIDNYLVYILPYMVVPFYVLLFRSYFQDNMHSLREAAIIDGASEFRTFLKIIIPVAIPVFAVVSLYTIVRNWNDWFTAQAFILNTKIWPLQTILLQVIKAQEAKFTISEAATSTNETVTPESIRLSMIIICMIPILIVYPLFQRYFMHGLMIGAVKG